jgi:D-sedoheptulose 7-phosphate isomerase
LQKYIEDYLLEASQIIDKLDRSQIQNMVQLICDVRDAGGRLFFLGVGGSAANASHAVNDFRKIANIESYCPTDNVAELTARINDDGWDTAFANWLKGSRLRSGDAIFILSVGGGNIEKNISVNLVKAIEFARSVKAKVLGVVGPNGGYTAKSADACVRIPVTSANTITPHSEAFQAVVWHLIVSHPELKVNEMKWEKTK